MRLQMSKEMHGCSGERTPAGVPSVRMNQRPRAVGRTYIITEISIKERSLSRGGRVAIE